MRKINLNREYSLFVNSEKTDNVIYKGKLINTPDSILKKSLKYVKHLGYRDYSVEITNKPSDIIKAYSCSYPFESLMSIGLNEEVNIVIAKN